MNESNPKKPLKFTDITCVNDRLGLEVGITLNKQYTLIERTNRYFLIKNDYGVICRYWKGFFKPTNQVDALKLKEKTD